MSLDQLKALQQHFEERALRASRNPYTASKVFAIPELLETVLLHLHFTEIFVVMRVDRTFNDTIASSVKLRREVFLARHQTPTFKPISRFESVSATSLPTYNPLIEPVLEVIGFVQYDARYLAGDSEEDDTCLLELAYTNNSATVDNWLGEATRWCAGPSREFTGSENGKTGSWTTTLLTAYPMRVKVWFSCGPETFVYDEETVCYYLEVEEATVGRLFDVGVKARQVLEEGSAGSRC